MMKYGGDASKSKQMEKKTRYAEKPKKRENIGKTKGKIRVKKVRRRRNIGKR